MSCHHSYDIVYLLSSSRRDFLIRSNNDKVKIKSLKGKKKLGLYFPGSEPQHFYKFTPYLLEFYNEVAPIGDFEIVEISADKDYDKFRDGFANKPWLAIPFSDRERRDLLNEAFKVTGSPRLVILGENGEVLSDEGVDIILDYGFLCYPFAAERIEELEERAERARSEQTLRSLLIFQSRDYVISSNGEYIPISELEGKSVGLYFAFSGGDTCVNFTPKLIDVYEKLKAKGEKFEIVSIFFDECEPDEGESLGKLPWLALPFSDVRCMKLERYFRPLNVPTVVIIGPDGKTIHSNVVEAIEDHGTEAFPFTHEKIAELDKRKEESQTLESLFVVNYYIREEKKWVERKRDFVIDSNGNKIPVYDLEGKNILLYFGNPRCDSRKYFEAFDEIKAKDDAFEVIFITPEDCTRGYIDSYSEKATPWLELPVGDDRNASLRRKFKVEYEDLVELVALGPTGRTVSKNVKELIMLHGAEAYPFTNERLKEIEERYEAMAKALPPKLNHALHAGHELVLTRHNMFYTCDGCEKEGKFWSFNCEDCDFDLHPKCALEENNATKDVET